MSMDAEALTPRILDTIDRIRGEHQACTGRAVANDMRLSVDFVRHLLGQLRTRRLVAWTPMAGSLRTTRTVVAGASVSNLPPPPPIALPTTPAPVDGDIVGENIELRATVARLTDMLARAATSTSNAERRAGRSGKPMDPKRVTAAKKGAATRATRPVSEARKAAIAKMQQANLDRHERNRAIAAQSAAAQPAGDAGQEPDSVLATIQDVADDSVDAVAEANAAAD